MVTRMTPELAAQLLPTVIELVDLRTTDNGIGQRVGLSAGQVKALRHANGIPAGLPQANRAPKLTTARIEELKPSVDALGEQGLPDRGIAEQLGISLRQVGTVRRYVAAKAAEKTAAKDHERAQVADLAAKKLADPQIADILKCSDRKVRRIRERHGIPAGQPKKRGGKGRLPYCPRCYQRAEVIDGVVQDHGYLLDPAPQTRAMGPLRQVRRAVRCGAAGSAATFLHPAEAAYLARRVQRRREAAAA